MSFGGLDHQMSTKRGDALISLAPRQIKINKSQELIIMESYVDEASVNVEMVIEVYT